MPIVDAHGRRWSLIDKLPIFTAENLDASSMYPQPGVLICEILERTDDLAKIRSRWAESVEGVTEFEVLSRLLSEWQEEGI